MFTSEYIVSLASLVWWTERNLIHTMQERTIMYEKVQPFGKEHTTR